jgi:microcystin-dependent protein
MSDETNTGSPLGDGASNQPRVTVGPDTDTLKSKFRSQSVPLEQDFADLIDIADVGRRALGQNPRQDGVVGAGLVVDSEGKLSIDVSAAGFVKGMIMMFSGASIPKGWALCDGTDGTPNLVDRFILGGKGDDVGTASSGASFTGTGGSKSFTATTAAVSLSVTVSDTTLTIDQIPEHSHLVARYYTEPHYIEGSAKLHFNDGVVIKTWDESEQPIGTHWKASSGSTGGSLGHNHGASVSPSSHSHTASITPPYYILAFIMKV